MSRATVGIIGAGPAGIGAALAVARHGARAVIIERHSLIGGAATNAMVGTVCGLSRCGKDLAPGIRFDNPGCAREFGELLALRSGTSLIRNEAGLTYLPYHPNDFEHIARELLSQASTSAIVVNLNSPLVGAQHHPSSNMFSLRCANEEFACDSLVDCSGDAVALTHLGLSTEEPTKLQAAALVFEVCELPSLSESLVSFLIRKVLREGVLANEIPEPLSYVSIVPGSLGNNRALFKLATEAPNETTPARAVQFIEQRAREDISALVAFLNRAEPSLSASRIGVIAPGLGVRSGRRGRGIESLSERSVRLSERSPSGVALGLWPVELWSSPLRPEIAFPEQGCSYEIPLGSLCSAELPGVYFAGRCISACDYAIASARVMGTCLSTGYAAGRAAIGFARGESSDEIVGDLRELQVNPFYRPMS